MPSRVATFADRAHMCMARAWCSLTALKELIWWYWGRGRMPCAPTKPCARFTNSILEESALGGYQRCHVRRFYGRGHFGDGFFEEWA